MLRFSAGPSPRQEDQDLKKQRPATLWTAVFFCPYKSMDKIYPYIYHEHLLNVGKIYQDIYDIYLYIYIDILSMDGIRCIWSNELQRNLLNLEKGEARDACHMNDYLG